MNDSHPLIGELAPLVGIEHSPHDVNYALKVAVRSLRFPVVGALQVTCSDEAEFETIGSFQTSFARDLLPRLKFSHRAAFHTANLGGCFEWDSLRVAAANFACAARSAEPMVIVVKISAHVAAEESRGRRSFGILRRYGGESRCCGALAALLHGAEHPRAPGLHELLASEGIDRLDLVRRAVATEIQPLALAVLAARLQARSATLEAQDLVPSGPVLFLVVPAVTLNKPARDAEIVCGLYLIDRLRGPARAWYRGLGDRPEAYEFLDLHGRLTVRDEDSHVDRPARDHRRLVHQAWERDGRPELARDQRIEEALAHARRNADPDPHLTRALLKTVLLVLAEASPVPAALLLFSQGAAGIYHAWRAHRLVEDVAASDEAREVLADLHRQVDRLPPERARQVLEVLLAEYGPRAKRPG